MDCTGYRMDVETERACLTCKVVKPAGEFNLAKHEKLKQVRLNTRCKACAHDYYIQLRDRDPEGMRARQKVSEMRHRERQREAGTLYENERRRWMRSNYCLTPETFAEILESQGNACAICRTTTPGGERSWHIDHDHACCSTIRTCGKCVRGILCSHCNTRLAWFERRGPAAAAYLEKYASSVT